MNHFCKTPLWECTRTLSAVAMGRIPAETVIRDGNLVNVCTHEILPHTDVAIHSGRIALVGDASGCIGPETRVVDAGGKYLLPGLLDGHIHVESSMLSVGEYARTVIPHGTVGIYYDPHEICNVLGLDGVALMERDAARTPLKAMLTVPSCVPAMPGFEDSGAVVTARDIARQMQRETVVGLGEMMNFPGILQGEAEPHAIVAETLKAGKTVTGHYAAPETGQGLNAYIAAGACCCHESTRAEDALAKMRLGMYAMLREGSAWRDLHEVGRAILEQTVDTRFAVLVSDDAHPATLLRQGHMDHILRRAVEEGIDPITAVQMATINCAQCFGMERELGSIAPGKCADVILVEDLTQFRVTHVFLDGELVAQDGRMCREFAPFRYPEDAMHTMHVGEAITPETFRIPTEKTGQAQVRVMEIIPGRVGNRQRRMTLPVENGRLEAQPDQDVLKAFVFERHHATGAHGVGFVKGFGIRRGAMASTVAHDAHNLLVIGASDSDMALAANTLIACGGGMCAVLDGVVLGCVPLPLAGLMNDQSGEQMCRLVEQLTGAWQTMGCTGVSPFMTMALLCLACLPELRLTNRGLVDCQRFCFVPLEADEPEALT